MALAYNIMKSSRTFYAALEIFHLKSLRLQLILHEKSLLFENQMKIRSSSESANIATKFANVCDFS